MEPLNASTYKRLYYSLSPERGKLLEQEEYNNLPLFNAHPDIVLSQAFFERRILQNAKDLFLRGEEHGKEYKMDQSDAQGVIKAHEFRKPYSFENHEGRLFLGQVEEIYARSQTGRILSFERRWVVEYNREKQIFAVGTWLTSSLHAQRGIGQNAYFQNDELQFLGLHENELDAEGAVENEIWLLSIKKEGSAEYFFDHEEDKPSYRWDLPTKDGNIHRIAHDVVPPDDEPAPPDMLQILLPGETQILSDIVDENDLSEQREIHILKWTHDGDLQDFEIRGRKNFHFEWEEL